MKTATAVLALAQSLAGARGASAIETIATAEVATSPEAMGTSFRKSADLHAALEHARWDLFEILPQIDDDRAGGAKAVWANLKEALESDELAVGLATKISELEGDAIKLLAPPKIPKPSKPTIDDEHRKKDGTESETRRNLSLSDAQRVFSKIEQQLKTEADARVDLSWTLHKGTTN